MRCGRKECPNDAAPGWKYCSPACAPGSKYSNREAPPAARPKRAPKTLTIDEIQMFEKRAKYVARKRGYPELADDFAQEMFLAFSNGRIGATVEQLFIDFLRKESGRAGTPGFRDRALARARTFSLDEPAGEEDGGVLHHDIIARPGGDREPVDRVGQAAHLFSGIEGELYQLYFLDQMLLDEIAAIFGVTESRICQRVGRMRKEIAEFHLAERVLERFEDDESFGILEVAWL